MGALLVVAGIFDAREGRVPAKLSAWTLAAAVATVVTNYVLALAGFVSPWPGALWSLAVAAPFLVAWFFMPSSTGGADVKLTAAAALASGWPAAAAVVIMALATLLVVQLWARLRRRQAPTVYCAALAAFYLVVM